MVVTETTSTTTVVRNQKILLVRRPDGLPKPDDFRLEEIDLVIPSLHFCPTHNRNRNGQESSTTTNNGTSVTTTNNNINLLLETLYVSIDPAMRGWMSSAKSYLPPVALGSVMRASTVSKVIAAWTSSESYSDSFPSSDFPIGSIVRSEIVGVQSYYVLKDCSAAKAKKLLTRLHLDQRVTALTKVLPNPNALTPTSTPTHTHKLSYASYLGVLGTTGLTAYFGLLAVGKPKPADTVLVSGAAGATGSIVAQIAKHVVGCRRVIGTAGTDAKCQWLESNQIVDVAINYNKCPTTGSLAKAISRACASGKSNDAKSKKGVDIVFDNVGSAFLEAALSNLAFGARIVLCGAISQYNNTSAASSNNSGPRNYMNLLVRRATMTGFVVFDYQKKYETAIADLVRWIGEGRITCYGEDMRHAGIEQFYPALLSLFKGTNVGKVVLTAKSNTRSKL